ncbi:unnamed protein product, partial [Ectocarpus sp. 12 AP-2014]
MLLHRRQCEVRVCQGRHLVPKGRKRNGDKPAVLVADAVWALMSIDGKHNTTESCRNIKHPSWERVAVFDLNLCRAADGIARGAPAKPPRDSNPTAGAAVAASAASSSPRNSSATFERPSAVAAAAPARKNKAAAAATPTAAAVKRSPSSSLNPFAVAEAETQSLNPFASNFVPPAATLLSPPPPAAASPRSKSPCPPAPAAAAPVLRASMILHLRVLHGRLRSKEVLGDVAVDLVPLLRSGGDRLATDRLEWLGEEDGAPLLPLDDGDAGVITTPPPPPLVVVDTWVSLRQGTAELRVQILIKPPQEPASSNVRSQRAQVGGDEAWAAAFEALSADGLVKTSLDLEQRSLDERLLDVQETYDFSAGSGYREGKPDEDEGARNLDQGKEGDPKTPEWPASEPEAARLRRDMQLAALRDRRQSIAWAEKLGSSADLREALRRPPPFSARSSQGPAAGGKRAKPTAAPSPFAASPVFRDLKELVAQGIPPALRTANH